MRKSVDETRSRYGFRLFGYVVMPEHVHLLISEPDRGTPSSVLQVLKQRVSRALRRERTTRIAGQLSLRFVGEEAEARAFWQRRFYDFTVWSTKKVLEKLEYRHENPVKHNLVLRARDWPWSSWRHHAKRQCGLIRIDALEGRRTQEKIRTLTNQGCGTFVSLGANLLATRPETYPGALCLCAGVGADSRDAPRCIALRRGAALLRPWLARTIRTARYFPDVPGCGSIEPSRGPAMLDPYEESRGIAP